MNPVHDLGKQGVKSTSQKWMWTLCTGIKLTVTGVNGLEGRCWAFKSNGWGGDHLKRISVNVYRKLRAANQNLYCPRKLRNSYKCIQFRTYSGSLGTHCFFFFFSGLSSHLKNSLNDPTVVIVQKQQWLTRSYVQWQVCNISPKLRIQYEENSHGHTLLWKSLHLWPNQQPNPCPI